MNVVSATTIAKHTVKWSVAVSVVMIVAGVLAIVMPGLAGRTVMAFLGSLLIYAGIAHIVFGWEMRTTGAFVWEVFLGILYIAVGGYVFSHLSTSLAVLTVGLGIYLFLEAILEFVLSRRLRPLPGSGWLAFDSILTVALAILIWRPWSTPWAIGVLIGISMLFSGISRLALSLATDRVLTKLP